jgi:hypothetical protein
LLLLSLDSDLFDLSLKERSVSLQKKKVLAEINCMAGGPSVGQSGHEKSREVRVLWAKGAKTDSSDGRNEQDRIGL